MQACIQKPYTWLLCPYTQNIEKKTHQNRLQLSFRSRFPQLSCRYLSHSACQGRCELLHSLLPVLKLASWRPEDCIRCSVQPYLQCFEPYRPFDLSSVAPGNSRSDVASGNSNASLKTDSVNGPENTVKVHNSRHYKIGLNSSHILQVVFTSVSFSSYFTCSQMSAASSVHSSVCRQLLSCRTGAFSDNL